MKKGSEVPTDISFYYYYFYYYHHSHGQAAMKNVLHQENLQGFHVIYALKKDSYASEK